MDTQSMAGQLHTGALFRTRDGREARFVGSYALDDGEERLLFVTPSGDRFFRVFSTAGDGTAKPGTQDPLDISDFKQTSAL